LENRVSTHKGSTPLTLLLARFQCADTVVLATLLRVYRIVGCQPVGTARLAHHTRTATNHRPTFPFFSEADHHARAVSVVPM
jgi:hypothetical protein